LTREIERDEQLFRTESLAKMRDIAAILGRLYAGLKPDKPDDELKEETSQAPDYHGGAPTRSGQEFRFSNLVERSIFVDPFTKRIHRRLRFRIRSATGTMIRDLTVRAYLVLRSLSPQPDGTMGEGHNWKRIVLPRRDNYVPILRNYWSFSHYIDPRPGNSESVFIEAKNKPLLTGAWIRIYLSGFYENSTRVFGEWEYEWSSEATRFGQFRLRAPGEQAIQEHEFNEIIEQDEPEVEWPLLDVNKVSLAQLEKRIRHHQHLLE